MPKPDTPPPFARKLDRAAFHIGEMQRAIDSHLNSQWYTQDLYQRPDGTWHLKFSYQDPPTDLSTLLGDAIHNMRAALDLLAVWLVERNNQNAADVYFPFAGCAQDLDEMISRSKFHRAGQANVAILRSLQPYKGGNLMLRAVHDLDIQDKHRALIPHLTVISTGAIGHRPKVEGDYSQGIVFVPDLSVPPKATFNFPKNCASPETEIIPTLWNMHATVADAVARFLGAYQQP